jgi:hypothetical protein
MLGTLSNDHKIIDGNIGMLQWWCSVLTKTDCSGGNSSACGRGGGGVWSVCNKGCEGGVGMLGLLAMSSIVSVNGQK